MGVGFSAKQVKYESMSFSSFSAGLGQVAKDLESGKIGADSIRKALSSAEGQGKSVTDSVNSSVMEKYSKMGFSGAQSTASSNASWQNASSVSVSNTVSTSISNSSSVTIPVTKQVETSRVVMVPKETKVQVPVTKQVPDLANAGKLETSGNTITTPGGYKVRLEGDTAFVTAPNGKQIRVWGDPHIEHDDGKGGKQNIDFRKGTTTFALPDGTRVTMNAYNDKGQLAANGFLGKVDVYNGNKHVTLSNGRDVNGKMGAVKSSGVKNDGYAAAAKQATGDVLEVVGNGAQLAHKGKLTKHESVSGTVRQGEWATGAAVGKSAVGAMSVPVPMKTITVMEEVTKKTFEPKVIKEMKTVTEQQTITSNFSVSAGSSFAASGSSGVSGSASASLKAPNTTLPSHNAFAVNGGFGGFKTGSFGDHSLASVAGAMGGAGLYGDFKFKSGHRSAKDIAATENLVSSFPSAETAQYVQTATREAVNVFRSYNSAVGSFNEDWRRSRLNRLH